jgi:hypothetical protein
VVITTDPSGLEGTPTMTTVWRRSRGVVPVVAAALCVVGALTGCSGTGGGASAVAGATTATGPTGPCDKAGFAAHAGLAAGAIQTYVWRPVRSGALKPGAKGRTAALTAARQASALAAHELTAASPLVTGCPSGTRLMNALTTGTSLVSSASKQLAGSSVNQLTLAGANSITTTLLQEAKVVGIDVAPLKPTARQLAAGTAG